MRRSRSGPAPLAVLSSTPCWSRPILLLLDQVQEQESRPMYFRATETTRRHGDWIRPAVSKYLSHSNRFIESVLLRWVDTARGDLCSLLRLAFFAAFASRPLPRRWSVAVAGWIPAGSRRLGCPVLALQAEWGWGYGEGRSIVRQNLDTSYGSRVPSTSSTPESRTSLVASSISIGEPDERLIPSSNVIHLLGSACLMNAELS